MSKAPKANTQSPAMHAAAGRDPDHRADRNVRLLRNSDPRSDVLDHQVQCREDRLRSTLDAQHWRVTVRP
jgi:hypothetical protein